jgi:hypothetical protein
MYSVGGYIDEFKISRKSTLFAMFRKGFIYSYHPIVHKYCWLRRKIVMVLQFHVSKDLNIASVEQNVLSKSTCLGFYVVYLKDRLQEIHVFPKDGN